MTALSEKVLRMALLGALAASLTACGGSRGSRIRTALDATESVLGALNASVVAARDRAVAEAEQTSSSREELVVKLAPWTDVTHALSRTAVMASRMAAALRADDDQRAFGYAFCLARALRELVFKAGALGVDIPDGVFAVMDALIGLGIPDSGLC